MKQYCLILCLVLTILLSYGSGYYRGYERASLIHADMTLVMNEAAYSSLERNQQDRARNYLLVPVAAARHYMIERQRNPVVTFLKDFRTDRPASFTERSRLMVGATAMIEANRELLLRNNTLPPQSAERQEPRY